MKIWLPLIATATGAEVYTRRLADGLVARGHDVTLDVVPHRYQYAPWFAPISPSSGTDVILANSWSAAAFARHGIPLVSVCHLVVHDPVLRPFKSLAQRAFHRGFVLPMERRGVARASRNIAVSSMVAAQMRHHLGAGEVDVVLNGVDTDFFKRGSESRRDRLNLIFVGKPSLRKGFDTVAEILSQLDGTVDFTCVGPPPASGLPRPDGTYTGPKDRYGVRAALRSADLLLFPSRMEGFGLVAAEAMACGVPVVGCTGTPLDEFVPHDAGILRAPDDVDGFASAICNLQTHPDRLATMSTAARNAAVSHLSEAEWIERTEQVLRVASNPEQAVR